MSSVDACWLDVWFFTRICAKSILGVGIQRKLLIDVILGKDQ